MLDLIGILAIAAVIFAVATIIYRQLGRKDARLFVIDLWKKDQIDEPEYHRRLKEIADVPWYESVAAKASKWRDGEGGVPNAVTPEQIARIRLSNTVDYAWHTPKKDMVAELGETWTPAELLPRYVATKLGLTLEGEIPQSASTEIETELHKRQHGGREWGSGEVGLAEAVEEAFTTTPIEMAARMRMVFDSSSVNASREIQLKYVAYRAGFLIDDDVPTQIRSRIVESLDQRLRTAKSTTGPRR